VLIYHGIASLGVMLVVAIVAQTFSHRIAKAETERDAHWIGQSVATGLIGPLVTQGVRAGVPADMQTLDAAARARIASGTVLRIKVWSADGTVLYSDAPALIGKKFELDPDDIEVVNGGPVDSDVSDVNRPENVYERGLGQLVEVYARAIDQTGQPVLVETYFAVDRLKARTRELERGSMLVLLSSLLVLGALMLPLSVWLAKRAERSERERLAAERAAADAALAERKRLAAELHDGVIQDLTAVGYALYSLSRGVERYEAVPDSGGAELTAAVDRISEIVRTDIAVLRGVSTSMYFSQGQDIDLSRMIRDLIVAGPEGVRADIDDLPPLSASVVSAVFQVAREALRNSLSHSGDLPRLTLRVSDERLALTVTDRGAGYDPEKVSVAADGHLGMTLLEDAAARVGGVLKITTAPGRGTIVRLTVDLRGLRPNRSPEAMSSHSESSLSATG
jgi:signal transduction histidine kinase